VAAKKKTPWERKKGTERYALKKPTSTTTTAMFAAFCTTAAAALDYEIDEINMQMNETNITYPLNDEHSEHELYTTIIAIVIGFLVMIGAATTCRCLTTWPRRAMTALHALWKVITLKEVNTLETAEQATQIDRDPLIDDLNELLAKNIHLEEMLTETENRLAETDEAYTNIQTILRDYNHDRRRTIIQAGQQEIYFTAEGRAWHASYQCLPMARSLAVPGAPNAWTNLDDIQTTKHRLARQQAEFGSGVFANFNFSYFSPV
jgi:hypothetical protein